MKIFLVGLSAFSEKFVEKFFFRLMRSWNSLEFGVTPNDIEYPRSLEHSYNVIN